MLRVEDVHAYYGDSHVLKGVSFQVARGETVAVLGRNGAGKTTTFRAVAGLTPPRRGEVRLEERSVARRRPHAIAQLGICYVPSGRRVFGDLTVRQNLQLAQRDGGEWTPERVLERFPILSSLADRRAQFLSGGEQQLLKIGRGLVGNPKVLMLDEPSEGLAPVIVQEIAAHLRTLAASGMTILMCEQQVPFALSVAERVYILETGAIVAEGAAEEIRDSPMLRKHLSL